MVCLVYLSTAPFNWESELGLCPQLFRGAHMSQIRFIQHIR